MWFVSAETNCLGAWRRFVAYHVMALVHGTVQVKTADSPAVTLTLNGPPNIVSERLKPCVESNMHTLSETGFFFTAACVLQAWYTVHALLGNKTGDFDNLMCTTDIVTDICECNCNWPVGTP